MFLRILFAIHVYEQLFLTINVSEMIRKLGKNYFKMTFYEKLTQSLTSRNQTIWCS